MHDNHHLQSTVAQQNTGETRDTVLSRRATALLRRLRISIQSALEINLRIHEMRAITLLEQIHRCGYIYRDMKPQNFLIGLGPNGMSDVYLLDFGLSKSITL